MKMLLLMLVVTSIMGIINVVIYHVGIPQWVAMLFAVPVGCIGLLDVWQD